MARAGHCPTPIRRCNTGTISTLLAASFLLAAADDQLVGGLLRLAGAVAERGLAPRRLGVAAGPGLALATAVRMVAGVHGRASHGRAYAKPPAPAGLAPRFVLVLDIADLADRRLAAHVDAAQLAGRHADHRVVALLRQQLGRRTRRSDELATSAERELDVVNGRADRDTGERQRVADTDRRVFPTLDGIAHLQSERGEDVALLSVLVVDERDAGAAIRVVLDRCDTSGDAVLVALEVDLSVQRPVATALVTNRDAALVVAAGVVRKRFHKALLGLVGGDLLEPGDRHETASRTGRLELAQWHAYTLPNNTSILDPTKSSISRGPPTPMLAVVLNTSEQSFDLLAGAERDDGLLPVGGVADGPDAAQAATALAPHAHGVDVLHFDALRFVLLLERFLDVGLGSVRGNAKRVPALRIELVGALGDDRADHDLGGGSRGHSGSSWCVWTALALERDSGRPKFSSRSSRLSFAISRYVWVKTSRMLRLRARMILAPLRFSNERLTT